MLNRICLYVTILGTIAVVVRSASAEQNRVMSLAGCVEYALENSPRGTAAGFRLQAVSNQFARVRSLDGPQVRLSAEALHYDALPAQKQNLLGPGSEYYQVTVDASKVLYSPALRAQMGIAGAEYLSASERLRRVRQQLIFDVAAGWYEVRRNQKRVEADRASLDQLEAHEQMTKEYFRLGKVAEVDVLRVGVRVANARQRLIASENAVKLAVLQLRNVMGLGASEPLELPPAPDEIRPSIGPFPDVEQLVEQAWRQRPEILAAEAQVARLEAERRQAAAGLQPEARAVANYMREGTSWPDVDQWFVGIRAALPLYDGGVTQNAKAAAGASIEAAKADLETVRQLVQMEVMQGQLRLREGAERIAATMAAVSEAERALTIERRGYEVGMNTILDVLDTETALTVAAYNYIDAVFTYHTAEAQLLLALGSDGAFAPSTSEDDR